MSLGAIYSYVNDLTSDPNAAINYLEPHEVTYPDSNQINIFGPVYLPKVYGKDLTAFEIASSGKIAVTIQDFYAFDLDRPAWFNGHSNTTMLQTQSNGNLLLSTTNSNAYVFLNADEGKVEIYGDAAYAGSNLLFDTPNAFIHILGDHIDYYALSNHTFTTSNNFIVEAEQGITLTASNADVILQTLNGNAILAAPSASVSLTGDRADLYALNVMTFTAGDSFSVTSSNSTTFWTSNSFTATAQDGDITLQTLNGNAVLAAPNASVSLTGDRADTYALNEMTFTAGDSFSVTSSNSTTFWTSNSFTATAQDGDITLQTLNGNAILAAPNASVSLTGDRADTYALNEMTFTAGDSFSVTSSNSTTFWTSNSFTATAQDGDIVLETLSGNAILQAPAASVTLSNNSATIYAQSTMGLDAGDSLTMTSSNAATLWGASNVTLQSANTGVFLEAPYAYVHVDYDDVNVWALSNVSITASNNLNADIGTDMNVNVLRNATLDAKLSFTLYGGSYNSGFVTGVENQAMIGLNQAPVYTEWMDDMSRTIAYDNKMFMNSNDWSADIKRDITFVSSNITSFTSLSNVSASAGDAMLLSATNRVYTSTSTNESVLLNAGEIKSSTDTQHSFWLNGELVPRLLINSNGIRVQGDLDIYGSINSIDVTQTTLEVLDKTVVVSAGSNLTDPDADASGLVVGGDPLTDKSLIWHNNTGGVSVMGTNAGTDSEAYWELKGGAFRMSHSNISFAFRIGESGEFELLKKVGTNPHKVVARFGRTLL